MEKCIAKGFGGERKAPKIAALQNRYGKAKCKGGTEKNGRSPRSSRDPLPFHILLHFHFELLTLDRYAHSGRNGMRDERIAADDRVVSDDRFAA